MNDHPRWRTLAAPAVLASLLLIGPALYAQQPSGPTPPARSVNLTVEQRHTIKEVIKDMKVENTGANVPTSIGDVVPASAVQLRPMPVEVASKVPQVRTHSYFVKDDHVVVVDPKDNRIADVVE